MANGFIRFGVGRSFSLLLVIAVFIWIGGCNTAERALETKLHNQAPRSHVEQAEATSGNRVPISLYERKAALDEARLAECGKRIPNFHVVEPFLLRGAAPSAEGIAALKTLGVKTVIDLRIAPKHVAAERRLVESAGMRYMNLPMSAQPPSQKEIDTFLKTVEDPQKQPVYVHCQYGADRTGCMVGIYREVFEGWSFPKTYMEMRKYGFKPYLHKLQATVQRYSPESQSAAKERARVKTLLETDSKP